MIVICDCCEKPIGPDIVDLFSGEGDCDSLGKYVYYSDPLWSWSLKEWEYYSGLLCKDCFVKEKKQDRLEDRDEAYYLGYDSAYSRRSDHIRDFLRKRINPWEEDNDDDYWASNYDWEKDYDFEFKELIREENDDCMQ